MSVEYIDASSLPVRELFELTQTDFGADAFKDTCQEFAEFDAENSDEDLWHFQIGEIDFKVSLFVETTGRKKADGNPELRILGVSNAIASLVWWDSWDDRNSPAFESERKSFDEQYFASLAQVEKILGVPAHTGQDADARGHRFAYWRGKNGLLIVQQSALDLEFGCDINIWIQPWLGPNPVPKEAFVDFLTKQVLPPLVAMPVGWDYAQPELVNELHRELRMNLLHPLRNVKAVAKLRSMGQDDVLFELYGFTHPLAQVHLTWNVEWRKDWPSFDLFSGWDEWLKSLESDESL